MNDLAVYNKRLESVVELVIRFAEGKYDARGEITEEDDHVNIILSGLNMLGDELQHTKTELINKNNLLQNILNNIDEIVYVIDTSRDDIINKSKFSIMGSQIRHVLGYSQQALTGNFESWLKVLYPEDVEVVRTAIKTAVESGETVHFTYRMIHRRTRKYIWLEDTLVPKKDAKGNVTQLFGSARNITERKKAEEMLIEQKRFMDNILNALPADVVVLDEYHRYLFINPSAEKDPERRNWLIGKNDFDLCKKEGLDVKQAEIRKQMALEAIRSEKEVEWIEENTDSPNEIKYILKKHQPVFEGNTFKYLVGYGIDISQLKKSEVEKEKLIMELSNRYNELMQFNYIVSHNLRAPVANILGLANVLKISLNEEEKNTANNHIIKASETIDRMLFDLNTILSAKSPLNEKMELFEVAEIIDEVKNNLEKQISDSKAEININIETGAEEMKSIKSYFQSTIFNLISNAIKYKSKEQPIIDISIKQKGNLVNIDVTDNGLGIDMKKHGKYIFGLYKRFHTEVEGKGLGLHMSKVQMESLGGSLSVKSQPDKGSCFTICLPRNMS